MKNYVPYDGTVSVSDRVAKGVYDSSPYPASVSRPEILAKKVSDLTVDEFDLAMKAKVQYEQEIQNFQLAKKMWQDEENLLLDYFKKDLELDYGTNGNPKANELFRISWMLGHDSGLNSVIYNYELLLPLVI